MPETFTPQEAAIATDASLPLVQKLITSKQIPTVGTGSRRRLDRTAVLAIALSRRLPRGARMTAAEAYQALVEFGDERLLEPTGEIEFGKGRLDVKATLSDTLYRLKQIARGAELVTRDAASGARVVKGLGVDADDLLGRLQAGETAAVLATEYPGLDAAAVDAVALWVEANPPRGRPRAREPLPVPAPRDLGAWTRTMQINARQIHEWAAGRSAPGALPRLVRRLALPASDVTEVTMPAGDSISRSGWDGELVSPAGNPWVPPGRSFWEMSCEASVTTKANDDYDKRTKETPAAVRASATLMIVTGRRWPQKAKWLGEKRATDEWGQVRPLDADDLEAWLEYTPAVALWFADEIGLTGPGVESPARYWESWAHRADPQITKEALYIDRDRGRTNLVAALRQRIAGTGSDSISVKADSAEEAAAFACATVLDEPELSALSLVVTDEAGWRFVEQNPLLKIVVVARPELGERPSRRTGLAIVVPYAAGDMNAQPGGEHANIVLERPLAHEFEQALCSMGADLADAKRWAATTGRSWSVYRRRRATNPSIGRPGWLDFPQADALSVVCLLGGWMSDHAADREVVAKVADRSYEDVERDLRKLVLLDDSPVLKLGPVWKAKAPLELLDLFGDRITDGELDRFFEAAKTILAEADPQLELADEDRYAARVYGKVRPQSGLLINALCDTLMKLAVRGPAFPGLANSHIEARVAMLVRGLLDGADGARWLSLASLLPQLAEAAPDAFLQAVESSLQAPGTPVIRLIEETSGSSIAGRCWHSGLLWALETLAWSPARLARVSLLMARLSTVSIKGNWGNTPARSLIALFRTWIPQTAAPLEQRIAVLDTLCARHAAVAFQLLNALVNVGHDTAMPSSRPAWRDDDAGAGHGATNQDLYGMLVAAADRMIAMSADHPERIAALLDKIQDFDEPRIAATLALVDPYTRPDANDSDRERIRAALRHKIHWLRNYGQTGEHAFKGVQRLEVLYQALEPQDVIVRHLWLFAESWPRPPARVRDETFDRRGGHLEKLREAALREVYAERGFAGVAELAAGARGTTTVGATLASLSLDRTTLADWIAQEAANLLPSDPLTATFTGLLRWMPREASDLLLRAVVECARPLGWSPDKLARFLTMAPEARATWDLADALGPEVEEAYWRQCGPGFWLRDAPEDFRFALQRLLRAGRPRMTLQLCRFDVKSIAPALLMDMMEGMLRGEEPDGALLSSWDVANIVDSLEANPVVDRERLARLEFALLRLLGYGGERKAKTLYRAVMTQPKLFAELITLVYKPRHAERMELSTDQERNAAETAWGLLRNSPAMPGQEVGGPIDAKAVAQFVTEVRELCRQSDRLEVCDITLGGILARTPAGAGGVWPHEAVRETLDIPEHGDIRRGLSTGLVNKRGVTSRAYYEGGRLERDLAENYRRHADALRNAYPLLAATLDAMAGSYDHDARREDTQAKLRIEGH